jgi:phosphoenolpyruvate carboxykinase (ATP)
MLGKKMEESKVRVWLINTGWSGGGFGTGQRIKLRYTRAMITAALKGQLDEVSYNEHAVFGLQMPMTCPDVPDEILDPRNTWADKAAYDKKANELASKFVNNFEKYSDFASDEIMAAAEEYGFDWSMILKLLLPLLLALLQNWISMIPALLLIA